MAKSHGSLSPKVNVLVIPIWALAAVGCFTLGDSHPPLALAGIGAVLGGIGGWMQHLSFAEASKSFVSATSLLEVRRAFTSTSWGRRYIKFLYVSKGILIVTVLLVAREPILRIPLGYLGGYFALMFVRELVTLRDTFALSRLPLNSDEAEAKNA